MGSVSYLGLWPQPILDPASSFICPFDGDPPDESGGSTIAQPLLGVSNEVGVNFIWKVKSWRISIDFTINIDWEFVFDDSSPTETGTLSVDRTASIVLGASKESEDPLVEEAEIPCHFFYWYSGEDVASMRPSVYDGGIGIEFSWVSPSNDYSLSNTILSESLDGSGGVYRFELPTTISFSSQLISTEFMVSMTTNPQELEDLFATLGAGFGTPLSATAIGTVAISEEETWTY